MPMTPAVERPMARSDDSSATNRSDMPLRDTSRISLSFSTSIAETTSSPSRRLIAMMPPVRFVSYSLRRGLLDQTAAGGEREVLGRGVVPDVEHLGDLLVRLQGEQVRDVLTLGVAAGLLHLVRLGAVDAAGVREEQQPVVGGGDEEVLDHVVGTQLRALDPATAAVLRR